MLLFIPPEQRYYAIINCLSALGCVTSSSPNTGKSSVLYSPQISQSEGAAWDRRPGRAFGSREWAEWEFQPHKPALPFNKEAATGRGHTNKRQQNSNTGRPNYRQVSCILEKGRKTTCLDPGKFCFCKEFTNLRLSVSCPVFEPRWYAPPRYSGGHSDPLQLVSGMLSTANGWSQRSRSTVLIHRSKEDFCPRSRLSCFSWKSHHVEFSDSSSVLDHCFVSHEPDKFMTNFSSSTDSVPISNCECLMQSMLVGPKPGFQAQVSRWFASQSIYERPDFTNHHLRNSIVPWGPQAVCNANTHYFRNHCNKQGLHRWGGIWTRSFPSSFL